MANNNSGDANAILYIVGLSIMGALFMGYVFWTFFHEQLVYVVRPVSYYCLLFIGWLYKIMFDSGISNSIILQLLPYEILVDYDKLVFWIPNSSNESVEFKEFVVMLEIIGHATKFSILILLPSSIYFLIKYSKAARLTNLMNIEKLARYNMKYFPQIRPAIIENLKDKDPDNGPYRREDSPIRFAIKNKLIRAYKKDYKGNLLNETSIPTFDKSKSKDQEYTYINDDYSVDIPELHGSIILDEDRTKQVFEKQLGYIFKGVENLDNFTKSLFAVFIAQSSADKDTAHKLLAQFNRSWNPGKKNSPPSINTKGVDSVINKYIGNKLVNETIDKHAYITTVMMALLRSARTKGKLLSCHFIWLKSVNRTLWYCLNAEGGQCAWTEAAGPRSHLLAEISCNGPLYKPFVDNAEKDYLDYLLNTEGWIPLDEDLPNDGRLN